MLHVECIRSNINTERTWWKSKSSARRGISDVETWRMTQSVRYQDGLSQPYLIFFVIDPQICPFFPAIKMDYLNLTNILRYRTLDLSFFPMPSNLEWRRLPFSRYPQIWNGEGSCSKGRGECCLDEVTCRTEEVVDDYYSSTSSNNIISFAKLAHVVVRGSLLTIQGLLILNGLVGRRHISEHIISTVCWFENQGRSINTISLPSLGCRGSYINKTIVEFVTQMPTTGPTPHFFTCQSRLERI